MTKESNMGETHYDLLRYVADHRNCTNRDVMEFHGSDPRGYLRKLRADGVIDGEQRQEIMRYWITPAGVRLLSKIDGGMGDYPTPRQAISGTYTGERWKVRPGSEPEPGYRRPMLIASKVQVGKGVTL